MAPATERPHHDQAQLPAGLQRLRLLTLASVYGLLACLFVSSQAYTTQLSPTTLVIWFVLATPLAAFLPSLHAGRPRAFAWLGFVSLVYFINAVLTAFAPGQLPLGLLKVFLCCSLFLGLLLYIRQYRAHFGSAL